VTGGKLKTPADADSESLQVDSFKNSLKKKENNSDWIIF